MPVLSPGPQCLAFEEAANIKQPVVGDGKEYARVVMCDLGKWTTRQDCDPISDWLVVTQVKTACSGLYCTFTIVILKNTDYSKLYPYQ